MIYTESNQRRGLRLDKNIEEIADADHLESMLQNIPGKV